MVLPTYRPLGMARCSKCGGSHALTKTPDGRILAEACGSVKAAPKVKQPAPRGKARCVLGHAHDSNGEASACSPIHTAAAHAGLTVFRPGRPGIPCFRVAPDDSGRPCYVAPDWVLCDAAGKPVLMLDWKPSASTYSMRRSESWPRGKRIVEAELNAKCVEIRSLDEIGAAIAALEAK